MFDGEAAKRLHAQSPGQLVAAAPHVLGFDPVPPSAAMIELDHQGQVNRVLYFDLTEASPLSVDSVAFDPDVSSARIIAYGSAGQTAPVLEALDRALAAADVTVAALVRVEANRYYSYPDSDLRRPREVGRVDRVAMADTPVHPVSVIGAWASRPPGGGPLAPITGSARVEMDRTQLRVLRKLANTPASRISKIGRRAVDQALATSVPLGDEQAAWLIASLHHAPTREYALSLLDRDNARSHLDLWSDLTKRAGPRLRAPAASLCAFAAWTTGEPDLAKLAANSALASRPAFPLAHMILRALTHDPEARTVHQALETGPPRDWQRWLQQVPTTAGRALGRGHLPTPAPLTVPVSQTPPPPNGRPLPPAGPTR